MHRRTLLAGTGATAASLLAGCAALPGTGGGGGSNDWDRIADWLAFGTHPTETRGDFSVDGSRPAAELAADADAAEASLEDAVPRGSGLEPADVEIDLDVFSTGEPMPSLYSVTLGAFDRGPVVDAFREHGLRRTGDDGEFVVLLREEGEEAWLLVSDGVVVWVPYATSTRGAPDVIRATARGERENLLEAGEPVASLLERLQPGIGFRFETADPDPEVSWDEPAFPGLTARGSASTLLDRGWRRRVVYRFVDTGAAADADVAAEWEGIERDPAIEDLELTRDGRFVEVSYRGVEPSSED